MTEEKKPSSLEELSEILNFLNRSLEEDKEYLAEVLDNTPYDTRLAVTAWAMKNILAHAREGGSYRYLIYDRLGFDSDAYGILQMAGGLEISNEFDIEQMDAIKEHVREHKIDSMKPLVNFCDEPNCFEEIGCGFPTENGYRKTCYEHWKETKENNKL